MGWRLTIDQTICCVGVIMNKALIIVIVWPSAYQLCHIVDFGVIFLLGYT